MEREGGGRGKGAEKEQLSLVEGKWRKPSMGWGVDGGGAPSQRLWPQGWQNAHISGFPLPFLASQGICPPATLEPSWPRTSRTEGAGEVGCDITLFIFPGLLQSSVSSKSFFSPLASEQMGPPLSERRGSIRGETLVLGRSPESNMLQSHASSYHTVGKPG